MRSPETVAIAPSGPYHLRDLNMPHQSDMVEPVTVIILAAGKSSRFREANKMLRSLDGRTVIEMSLDRAAASPVDEIIVVTGFQNERIEQIVAVPGVRTAFNPAFERGMASSIICGVKASRPDHHVLIWLGDMPLVTPDTAARIIEEGNSDNIVVPVFQNRRGHPVFFGRTFRAELLSVDEDRGARSILSRYPNSVVQVPVEDRGVIIDVDTEEDLRLACGILQGRN